MGNIRKNKNIDQKLFILITCLIGGGWFLFLYGIDVVDVTNDRWILGANSDITQHYLGWRYYRMSDWHLMFGLLDGITYPHSLSIIYMDVIPLFAVFFKILSPILPETFQYFGLYGFVSFMAQSCLAALLMDKMTGNKSLSILFGYFTLTYPVIYQRMFDHTALAGHWIIFLSIYVWYTKQKYASLKRESIRWGIVMSLAVFLHPYYIPMIVVMMCCSILEEMIDGKWKVGCFSGLFAVMAALFWMYCLGAFYGEAVVTDEGLGVFSLNLNGYYNPQQLGKLFKSWPNQYAEQAEGFAYLGAGWLVALLLTAFILLFVVRKVFTRKRKLALFYMVIMTMLALSPVITWNGVILFRINYPESINKFLSIFRSSGRFGWPVAYMMMTGTFSVLVWFLKRREAVCLVICLIGLQLIDLYPYMKFRAYEVTQRNSESMLLSEVWEEVAEDYQHIVFLTRNGEADDKLVSEYLGINKVFSIMKYAADNGMTLNDGYVSRRDIKAINQTKEQYWTGLLNGDPKEDSIYIFCDVPYDIEVCLHLYYTDELVVGVPKPFKNKLLREI